MKVSSRISLLIRRVHLYSGLFLLPWVIMYGVTGAMFNHMGLFPQLAIQTVDDATVKESGLSSFPSPDELATTVAKALQKQAGDVQIELASDPHAEYTGDLMFETKVDGVQTVVYLNPIDQDAWLATHPKNEAEPKRLLPEIHSIKLFSDPHDDAQKAASKILKSTGVVGNKEPQAFGWAKLNFLVNVDGQPARVTYVMKDGHIDINAFNGKHGMPLRNFLLRMHTSHGQPPHWNGRMFWSIAVDVMAIAMVGWGLSGLFMWWQIRRTRRIGFVMISLSLTTATFMYLGLQYFYASTRL